MKNILILLLFASRFLSAQTASIYEGKPVFHGAKSVGNYPGTPFLYTIPTTGERPILFSARELPKGLLLEESSGIIHGTVKEKGIYNVIISARNTKGETQQTLTLAIGDTLCLTPPLGWNSWNVFTRDIDEKMLMEIADAMVSSGMRDIGYQYINIDDFWHAAERDSLTGKPVANPQKFPHGIAYIADYLHRKGLKLGIYSDAGTKTCGKCFGGYTYEEIDAKTYAEWGVDLLKYDFCYTPWKKKEVIARYTKMGNALKQSGRSIVYSICNWGIFKPWEWAAEAGGNYWRTTPDIFDTWDSHFPFMKSVRDILRRQNKLTKYAGRGHWNDPDMLIAGNYGNGKATARNGLFKGLTDTEYQTHVSLWAVMCSPMLASCDLRNMNEATKNILLNAELLDINQDELGKQAQLIAQTKGLQVYQKPLANGQSAWVFFNTSGKTKNYKLQKYLPKAAQGKSVRDIWSHQHFIFEENTTTIIQKHEAKVWVL